MIAGWLAVQTVLNMQRQQREDEQQRRKRAEEEESKKLFYSGRASLCDSAKENNVCNVFVRNTTCNVRYFDNFSCTVPSINEGGRVMELFDKKFIHLEWEDELEDKKGFVADDICELTNCVLSGNFHHTKVRKSLNPASPFKDTNDNDWLFFYYDPNYEVKKAYTEGKQIQISGEGDIWVDLVDKRTPDWDSNFQFRIKSELNKICKYCKGKSCNCHNCKNNDKENSYWTLFRENCIKPEEPKSRCMTYRELSESTNSMKFDESRVYIMINADELEEDDIVFAADGQTYFVARRDDSYKALKKAQGDGKEIWNQTDAEHGNIMKRTV